MPKYEQYGDGVDADEAFMSPPILDPDGDEQMVVDVELRHILIFLGGIAIAGVVIAVVWEWVDHRLRMRRTENITSAITTSAQAIATILVESRQLLSHITLDDDNEQAE